MVLKLLKKMLGEQPVVVAPAPPALMGLSGSDAFAAAALIACALFSVTAAFFVKPGSYRTPDPRLLSTVSGWRLASAAAFALNVAVVSIPGRFDGDAAAAESMLFPWDTLFAPAGWAFAIWGIIYIGEFAGVLLPLFENKEGPQAEQVEAPHAPAWVFANVAQCLWCTSFRPWCLGLLWLPAVMLASTAACLLASQTSLHGTTPWVVSAPRSLHLGWVTAACLVNVNAFVGTPGAGGVFTEPAQALLVAHVSVLVAVLIGCLYALVWDLPAAALAVAWGLLAVSKGEVVGAAAVSLGANTLEGLASIELLGAGVVFVAAMFAGTDALVAHFSFSQSAASDEGQLVADTEERIRRRSILGLGGHEEDDEGGSGAKCDVVIVGCGAPGKSMGWYHALNLLQGLCPSAQLTDVVETYFLSPQGQATEGGKAFAAFAAEHRTSVRFHSSVTGMPPHTGAPGVPKVALIAGRTSDNPKLLREVIEQGCTCVYLEKPGAPTLGELEGMAAFAESKGVKVFMGYNKNVTAYVASALEAEKKEFPGASTAFYHNNTYTKEGLPECFERNSEGMLKNMAVHELCLLVTYYGVTADNLASVVPDKAYSSCQTLTGPATKAEFTDFDKLGFTVTTKQGRVASVFADRCGGVSAQAVVSDKYGKEVFRSETPDAALEARVKAQQLEHPDWMDYFLVQHDDYVALKERVCWAALDQTGNRAPNGVASIGVAVETLKLAEKLTPQLIKELT